jgi:Reverse transcriptase (RNA-dependent DNA polymerase)
VDSGDLVFLTLFNLSSAFDTVDHVKLLRRLEVSHGISGTVHNWFASYLGGRRRYVCCGYTRSLHTTVPLGVPQGSVLGLIDVQKLTSLNLSVKDDNYDVCQTANNKI